MNLLIEKLDQGNPMFNMIDNLVKQYPAYTHDDVYEMDWAMVIELEIKAMRDHYMQAKLSEERQRDMNIKR